MTKTEKIVFMLTRFTSREEMLLVYMMILILIVQVIAVCIYLSKKLKDWLKKRNS